MTLVRSRVEDVALPPASVDAILAMGSLQYTEDPAAQIARLAGWLRPGGVLAVLVDGLLALALELVAAGKEEEAATRLATRRGVWRVADVEADLHLLDAAALRAGVRRRGPGGRARGRSPRRGERLRARRPDPAPDERLRGGARRRARPGRPAGPGRPRQAAAHRGASPTSSRALSTDQKTRSASLTLSSDDMGRASAWSCRTSVTGSRRALGRRAPGQTVQHRRVVRLGADAQRVELLGEQVPLDPGEPGDPVHPGVHVAVQGALRHDPRVGPLELGVDLRHGRTPRHQLVEAARRGRGRPPRAPPPASRTGSSPRWSAAGRRRPRRGRPHPPPPPAETTLAKLIENAWASAWEPTGRPRCPGAERRSRVGDDPDAVPTADRHQRLVVRRGSERVHHHHDPDVARGQRLLEPGRVHRPGVRAHVAEPQAVAQLDEVLPGGGEGERRQHGDVPRPGAARRRPPSPGAVRPCPRTSAAASARRGARAGRSSSRVERPATRDRP